MAGVMLSKPRWLRNPTGRWAVGLGRAAALPVAIELCHAALPVRTGAVCSRVLVCIRWCGPVRLLAGRRKR